MTDSSGTAPRITIADIEASIASEHYFTAKEGVLGEMGTLAESFYPNLPESLGLLTFCVLVLSKGYTVVGKSACVSPENFDPAIGRDLARKNAVEQVWPLLAYELKSKLFNQRN